MAYERPGRLRPDAGTCGYGESRLRFRGPQRALDQPYCAVIGGTETFGKGVLHPWPDLLEDAGLLPMVNFGCLNAGPDAFLQDDTVLAACRNADVVLVQITGAHNLSNPYYLVHPRRNDRFLRATDRLRALYPDVDFTEFTFTRHLLRALQRRGPDRFAPVRATLQATWQDKWHRLLAGLPGPVVLLWMSDHAPQAEETALRWRDPVFVTRGMVDALRPQVRAVVEVVCSSAARDADAIGPGAGSAAAAMAQALPGPAMHRRVARALVPVLREVMPRCA